MVPGVSVSPGELVRNDSSLAKNQKLWGRARNLCFNKPSRSLCGTPTTIGNGEPSGLTHLSGPGPLEDSGSRRAILSVSWWEEDQKRKEEHEGRVEEKGREA